MSKYNYFSTFELTGLVKASRQDFLKEQLSAFFVSVPNRYITNNRSGIRHDCIEEVSTEIEEDILDIVDQYRRLFVLQLTKRPDNPERYMLRPAQYVFEFFYNYINTSGLVKGTSREVRGEHLHQVPRDRGAGILHRPSRPRLLQRA